jgi:uncharacterized protein
VVFARSASPAPWRIVPRDGTTLNRSTEELANADLVLNLTHRNIDFRDNECNRRKLKASRPRTTRLLGEAISQLKHPPTIWMNTSTATIYRDALDRPMDAATGEVGGNEPDAQSTWRFSIAVATGWESEFFAAKTPATRKIALHGAMVMSPIATAYSIRYCGSCALAWAMLPVHDRNSYPGFTTRTFAAPFIIRI